VVGQPAHLARRRLDQPLLAESERGAPQPGQRLDVLAPGLVEHVDAAPAGDDQRAVGGVLAQVGERVELVGDVAGYRRGRAGRHGRVSFLASVGPGRVADYSVADYSDSGRRGAAKPPSAAASASGA